VLADLIAQCDAQGSTAVAGVSGVSGAEVAAGCSALKLWDGRMNTNSKGAVVFREFAEQFATLDNTVKWENNFSAAAPTTTPNTLSGSPEIMQAFAGGLKKIKAAGTVRKRHFR
jgi:acyl-homoserine-lactone acylase